METWAEESDLESMCDGSVLGRAFSKTSMQTMASRRDEDVESDDALGAFNDVTLVFVDEGQCMRVSSHILAFSSLVFRAMLKSPMLEGSTQCIEVKSDIGSRDEFKHFYALLLPPTESGAILDADNVNGVLAFSTYYQVDRLKNACESLLIREVAGSAEGLLQAEKYGLHDWRAKCADELVEAYDYAALSALSDHPHLLLEIYQRMLPTCCKLVKPCRQLLAIKSRLRAAKEDAWLNIPETEVRHNNERVDKFVKEGMDVMLEILDEISSAMPEH